MNRLNILNFSNIKQLTWDRPNPRENADCKLRYCLEATQQDPKQTLSMQTTALISQISAAQTFQAALNCWTSCCFEFLWHELGHLVCWWLQDIPRWRRNWQKKMNRTREVFWRQKHTTTTKLTRRQEAPNSSLKCRREFHLGRDSWSYSQAHIGWRRRRGKLQWGDTILICKIIGWIEACLGWETNLKKVFKMTSAAGWGLFINDVTTDMVFETFVDFLLAWKQDILVKT